MGAVSLKKKAGQAAGATTVQLDGLHLYPGLIALNTAFDRLPDIEPGAWAGNSQRRDYTRDAGYELHNCLEFDSAFHALIDHPSWIGHVERYAGESDSYVLGVFIDECIATVRRAMTR